MPLFFFLKILFIREREREHERGRRGKGEADSPLNLLSRAELTNYELLSKFLISVRLRKEFLKEKSLIKKLIPPASPG